MNELRYFETTSDEEECVDIETEKARKKLDDLLKTKNANPFWRTNERYVIHGKVEDWKSDSVSFNPAEDVIVPVDLKKYHKVKPKRNVINKINTILRLFKLHLENENKTHYEDTDCF
jgi:hypothetical protein